MNNIKNNNNLHIYVTEQQNKDISKIIAIATNDFNCILSKNKLIILAIANLVDRIKQEGFFYIQNATSETIKDIRIHINIHLSQNSQLDNFKQIAKTDFNKRVSKDSLINIGIANLIDSINNSNDLKSLLEKYFS